MSLSHSIDALRCRLCRNGLLTEYGVYSRETDSFGIPGNPVLSAYTWGYFYEKNKRHYADVLEIAGSISSHSAQDHQLLAFDGNASEGDLVLIHDGFYRVASIREIVPDCRIFTLEVEHIAASGGD